MAIDESDLQNRELDPRTGQRTDGTEVNQAVVQTGIGPERRAVVSQTDEMMLNLGPSHPSTHGVLRVLLELDGEVIIKCVPDLGYLHRGIEKLGEYRMYNQFVPWTD